MDREDRVNLFLVFLKEVNVAIDLSVLTSTEQIVKVDEDTAKRYKVVEETIDLGALRIEKKGIEEQLSKVLTDEELLKWAKANYPYQNIEVERLKARLEEINKLLGKG